MHHDTIEQYVSRFKIVDTRFLMFRDIGDIVKEYVKGSKALDYGCGPAQSTLYLKSLNLDADGVDISERAIDVARILDPTGNYIVIESGEIPVGHFHYDLVFASIVFGHISTKEELQNIFVELVRVTKQGGIIIIQEFNEECYENRNFISFSTVFDENKTLASGSRVKIQFKDNVNVGNHYLYTDEDYINIIKNVGLTLIKTCKPLGKDSDGYEWLDEKTVPPCTIYVAQKV